jgi:hypothetical protein
MSPLVAAGLVGAGIQTGLGVYQTIKGAQMEKKAGERPEYQIPEEVYQSLTLAQRQAFEGLPAEQKQQFVENLRAMQTTGLGQLSDRKSGLAGVGQLASTATQGYRDLLSADVAARQANIQGYQQQLGEMAGYRDLAYQTNQLQPWQEQVEYGRAMRGAGIQQFGMATKGLTELAAYNEGLGLT